VQHAPPGRSMGGVPFAGVRSFLIRTRPTPSQTATPPSERPAAPPRPHHRRCAAGCCSPPPPLSAMPGASQDAVELVEREVGSSWHPAAHPPTPASAAALPAFSEHRCRSAGANYIARCFCSPGACQSACTHRACTVSGLGPRCCRQRQHSLFCDHVSQLMKRRVRSACRPHSSAGGVGSFGQCAGGSSVKDGHAGSSRGAVYPTLDSGTCCSPSTPDFHPAWLRTACDAAPAQNSAPGGGKLTDAARADAARGGWLGSRLLPSPHAALTHLHLRLWCVTCSTRSWMHAQHRV
jgi:hypothetical protein